jgi:hypothetical protein
MDERFWRTRPFKRLEPLPPLHPSGAGRRPIASAAVAAAIAIVVALATTVDDIAVRHQAPVDTAAQEGDIAEVRLPEVIRGSAPELPIADFPCDPARLCTLILHTGDFIRDRAHLVELFDSHHVKEWSRIVRVRRDDIVSITIQAHSLAGGWHSIELTGLSGPRHVVSTRLFEVRPK